MLDSPPAWRLRQLSVDPDRSHGGPLGPMMKATGWNSRNVAKTSYVHQAEPIRVAKSPGYQGTRSGLHLLQQYYSNGPYTRTIRMKVID